METVELSPPLARAFADAVLVLHCAFVAFVVGGLVLVWVGHGLGWGWVRRMTFRALHGAAIAVVVAQAWLGVPCPLTVLEQFLRRRAGAPRLGDDAAFSAGSLSRLLYVDAPGWVFTVAYSAFGLAVLWTAWRLPPRREERSAAGRAQPDRVSPS